LTILVRFGAWGREVQTGLQSGNLKGRGQLEDIGLDGRIILKCILVFEIHVVFTSFILRSRLYTVSKQCLTVQQLPRVYTFITTNL